MTNDFLKDNRLYFLEGAMGTMIQAAGLKGGELPELYNMTHPDIIQKIHESYIEAGADIITTNTFGANSIKLKPFGLTPEDVIGPAVRIAKGAAGNRLIALGLGPTGQLMAPMGTLSFNDAYDLFACQAKAGQAAGADLILIETISDIYEAKAAVLAIRENTDLPVICSLTFQEGGRTLMGTDPLSAITILESLGVAALGLNCSLGPDELLPIVKEFIKYAHVPVLVQPNAGLPQLIDGKPIYQVSPEGFAKSVRKMVDIGVRMVGGCCGTTPNFIKALRMELKDISPVNLNNPKLTAVASSRQTVIFDDGFKIIGERINPTGKKHLIDALVDMDMDVLFSEASAQKRAGADILDINVAAAGTDEKSNMVSAINYIQSMLAIPLQIDSMDPEILSEGARIYNGKALLNSVNGSKASMDAVFPIVKKSGTVVIGMTLDEKGVPTSAEARLSIAKRLVNTANEYGILKEDIIIDCLVTSALKDESGAKETMRALRMIKEELGVKTILGISNISFGQKSRGLINSSFLAMALEHGLDGGILDPTCPEIAEIINKMSK